jgi:hypothetical protein
MTKEDAEAAVTPRKKREKNTKLTCPSNHAEYHNKTITKLFGGNSLYGCYALAVTIFTLGIVRDSMYASLFLPSLIKKQPPITRQILSTLIPRSTKFPKATLDLERRSQR